MTALADARRQAEEALAVFDRSELPRDTYAIELEFCLRALLAATADPADAELSEAKATLARAYDRLADELEMERVWRQVVPGHVASAPQPQACCGVLHRLAGPAPCSCPCHAAASAEAPPAGDPRYVYLRVTRPEGYEDVHPDLVLADLRIADCWEVAVVEAPPAGTLTRDEALAAGLPIHPEATGVRLYGASVVPAPPAGDGEPVSTAYTLPAEALRLLRLVAAEGCRDEAGSGVTCREAAVPPADRCEVCQVIKYLAALDAAGGKP